MTICLCMIVRDEAAIIERCLNSVEGLADRYVIVDTGSTDGTEALIRDHYMLGELHQRPWVNFGHNRTELMELARGKADWLLLLDADHEVEWSEPATALDADSYFLRHAGELEYWVKRLVRGDWPWRYEGSTHEYLTVDPPRAEREERLDAIVVHDHYDGGTRDGKFLRDLRLLTAERVEKPDDPRVAFYLANTLRDLGHVDQAVATYRKRVELGGWEEEVFCSLLEIGRLTNSIEALFEAWSFRPQRAEALYELAWRFRQRGQHAAAFLVSECGRQLPVPPDRLFLSPWVYEWGLEFEYSIAAYWVGERIESLEACNRLLENPSLPELYRQQVEVNLGFCV